MTVLATLIFFSRAKTLIANYIIMFLHVIALKCVAIKSKTTSHIIIGI